LGGDEVDAEDSAAGLGAVHSYLRLRSVSELPGNRYEAVSILATKTLAHIPNQLVSKATLGISCPTVIWVERRSNQIYDGLAPFEKPIFLINLSPRNSVSSAAARRSRCWARIPEAA
jgi:hypothetical protein